MLKILKAQVVCHIILLNTKSKDNTTMEWKSFLKEPVLFD